MKNYTKKEFFNKVEWEGSFEGMAHYAGHVTITDDIDLHMAYNSLVDSLQDMNDILDDFEMENPEEEEDGEEE